MYVITRHHRLFIGAENYVAPSHSSEYDEVLLGPIDWRPSFIASVLQSDLELDEKPKILLSDEQRIPFDIVPNVRVRKVTDVHEPINPKIQYHEGPFWSYTTNEATAEYRARDKNIDIVKNELVQIVISKRYLKEVSGFEMTVQNTPVFISTDRDQRKIYFEKLAVIGDDGSVSFKFNGNFINLNKTDLQAICAAIDSHVQQAFDWEMTKTSEINALTTLQELDAYIIEPEEDNQ